jgi:hypothetical protein
MTKQLKKFLVTKALKATGSKIVTPVWAHNEWEVANKYPCDYRKHDQTIVEVKEELKK